MTIETDFRALLLAHAPLVSLVDDRVAQNAVEVQTPAPYVAFTSRHDLTHNLIGDVTADACTLTVQCWASGSLQADAVADAVQAAVALAPQIACATVLGRDTGYDDEVDLHATILTVEWWG